ncbi:exodeoxyribonuclease V subunit alpha [Georgenia sp. EYE_87]|uniref:exodeoxyribonuclease V subunit alpha n=1 Tax=Georgenia sp. EYE_87 TaxID=2853448 RepID=UPI002006467D|nr:exodeoxyribonuclease V subunit alpha [Georgenia sp. EYE_87]MCK6210143.1 exodeoxyribonuclease V subunit alpha [Georgenia sp. EYE_87]
MTVVDDVRVALRATPLLARFNAAGVLAAADVHVAVRLGRLAGEGDERVLLAVALAVRAVRSGSVCVRLDDLDALAVPEGEDAVPAGPLPWPEPRAWGTAVMASPVVAVGVDGPADRPARWVDGRLYLDRYWRDELLVRRQVDARLRAPVGGVDERRLAAAVHRLFPDARDDRQRLAAATAVLSRLTVLTGGPGTGKTTTVARVLAVLQDVAGPGLRIALAAPTGKAAARLQEAVREVVAQLDDAADGERVGSPEATTVHRLLGWRPGSSTRFRHDARHHLPHDVVVVDETSMVSLPLMARLLEALRPDARLLLVGDPDQLASVEAGAVLGDLVHRPAVADGVPGAVAAFEPAGLAEPEREQLRNGVVRLTTVHRQEEDSRILPLAAAIRDGDADRALAVLRAGGSSVQFVEVTGDRPTEEEIRPVRDDAEEAGVDLVIAAREGDASRALRALEAHRLMLAHRRGPAGVAHWAALVEQWVTDAAGPDRTPTSGPGGTTAPGAGRASTSGPGRAPASGADRRAAASPWYPGRPLLVTANDRETGLYNGDTGVVVADGEGGVVAVFGDPRDPMRVRPHRLPPVETVHAMTVHRGQGSQFGTVSLILPPATSPLLTRELLYTAVTRARESVRVVGTEEAVRAAVGRPVLRASGLREPLS